MTARDLRKADAPPGTPMRAPKPDRVKPPKVREICKDPELEAYGKKLACERKKKARA